MLEAEIQKLTAAVEALTAKIEALSASAPAPISEPIPEPIPEPISEPVHEIVKPAKVSKKVAEAPAPAPAPEPAAAPEPAPSVSKENLKDLALQISRADANTKSEIVSILASHNAKTITALPDDPIVLHDVFTRLNNLAAQTARAAE